jgi:hypothetical protein
MIELGRINAKIIFALVLILCIHFENPVNSDSISLIFIFKLAL